MDADSIFPEEMFYSSLPRRMGSRASRFFERELEAERDRERDILRRERWWNSLCLDENSSSNGAKNNVSSDKKTAVNLPKKNVKEPIVFIGELEYWPGEVRFCQLFPFEWYFFVVNNVFFLCVLKTIDQLNFKCISISIQPYLT